MATILRDELGRVLKGSTLNPNGRPKMARDLRKEYLDRLQPHKEKLFEEARLMAMGHDAKMMAFLLEPLRPKVPRDEYDEDFMEAQIKLLLSRTEDIELIKQQLAEVLEVKDMLINIVADLKRKELKDE